ncbi:hypothetical protein TKK_0016933 [Trichogramma kaykai]
MDNEALNNIDDESEPLKGQKIPHIDEKTQSPAKTPEMEEPSIEEQQNALPKDKLYHWQACQMAKSLIDNTINKSLENYQRYPNVPSSAVFEDPWYHLLKGKKVEDTAITMAIREHGLSRASASTSLQPLTSIDDGTYDDVKGEYSEDSHYNFDNQEAIIDRAIAEAINQKGLSVLGTDNG